MGIRRRLLVLGVFILAFWCLLFLPNSNLLAAGWFKTFGGDENDEAYSVQKTADGGYIIAGGTYSFGAGNEDVWIIKLDAAGNIEWQKTFGGENNERAYSIYQTADGGYIVSGGTYSFGSGDEDIWIIKLDADGNIEWQKIYGWSCIDEALAIQQTDDGGYIAVGGTFSFGSVNCITSYAENNSNAWIMKFDSNGNIEWQKVLGGSKKDVLVNIIPVDDGYISVGRTYSFGAEESNIWVVKLDNSGNIEWQKAYGNDGYDWAYGIQPLASGGYLVTGGTDSYGSGKYDIFILKIDEDGSLIWKKTYGGIDSDEAFYINKKSDDNYTIAGYSESFGGYRDAFAMTIDPEDGNIIWQKTYGANNNDEVHSVAQTDDGGFIFAGWILYFDSFKRDVLVIKTDANGMIDDSSLVHTPEVTIQDVSANVKITEIEDNVIDTPPILVDQYKLDIVQNGSGTINILSSSNSVSCSSSCSYNFNANNNVTLMAEPDLGYVFVGWLGDCSGCGTNPTCTITMTADMACQAKFVPRGDVNEDGVVNIIDALLAARCALGLVTSCNDDVANVDCSATGIDIIDALLIARKALGLLVPTWRDTCEE